MSKSKIVGWILSALLFVFLVCLSAPGKFMDFEGKAEMFDKLGWSEDVMVYIGFVEIGMTVLFLIPQTAFIGAILISAYLGGAVATHVRVDDPFIVPIVIGVLAWIALGLRDSRVFQLAFTRSTPIQPEAVDTVTSS
ncbi:DoxX family protein [Rhodopirellula sp. MGV]|uniref:DoxX family protein n=1 Tax=Rhodopirellula sp. MGV TaxID=2023130 RepID=UPI000B97AA1F|nr:DoxX family protein [Rhodopirellula sp. MGV]OYP36015.1 hypothetical protein CGZ80_09680 [Rhodopirellula sp. MGV]PNY36627.1 DoxX family protein [Rhodopirellula baltica]